MNIKTSIAAIAVAVFACGPAHALQYDYGRFAFKATGYGNIGLIEPDFGDPLFLGDWKVRGQMNYAIARGQTLGLVYSLNQQSLSEGNFSEDAFALWESANFGRIEVGYTDSIANKLALGVPDVGGLRWNDNPLFYKKIKPKGPVISDAIIDSGDDDLRINIASRPVNGLQYGLSVAGLSNHYNYALDGGLKLRIPNGKTKAAFSLGASFMDSPDNYYAAPYAPNVTADWRGQIGTGVNIQYNSWIWGLSARAIYDSNPVGIASDGLVASTGVSYDILKFSVSLSYVFSDTGLWHEYAPNYTDHTVMASFRYKYSENVDGWMSLGMTTQTPFVAAGIRLSF